MGAYKEFLPEGVVSRAMQLSLGIALLNLLPY